MEHKEFLQSVGNKIKTTRKRKGISQTKIADECGVDKSNISRLETGLGNPTIITILKVANALSVPIGKLLDDKEATD